MKKQIMYSASWAGLLLVSLLFSVSLWAGGDKGGNGGGAWVCRGSRGTPFFLCPPVGQKSTYPPCGLKKNGVPFNPQELGFFRIASET